MKTVTSKDGTTIAFDQLGKGPALILVDGALQYRAFDQGMAPLAELLAKHFTVIHYDRRGRGDSTDTQPYALEREIEDIEALIDAARGSAKRCSPTLPGSPSNEAAAGSSGPCSIGMSRRSSSTSAWARSRSRM